MASEDIVQQIKREPVNAEFSYKDNLASVTPSQLGYQYEPKDIFKTIEYSIIGKNEPKGVINGSELKPTVVEGDLQKFIVEFEKLASNIPKIKVDNKELLLNQELLTSIIVLNEDKTGITLEKNNLILVLNNLLNKPPGTTTVKLLDGIVVDRDVGDQGQGVKKAEATAEFQKWLINPDKYASINLSPIAIPAKIIEIKEYSQQLNAVLQEAIEGWVSNNQGLYNVAVKEIGGDNRVANVNAESTTVMASTYKMFLAVIAYQMVELGEIDSSTIIYKGNDVYECIEGAIKFSENECTAALGRYIGWSKLDQKVKTLGFNDVFLNNYVSRDPSTADKTASALSLVDLLVEIDSGKIINEVHREYLLSSMKNQYYRDGIPVGSKGLVANKVGFLDNLKHDMAIVYGPNSNYAIVILSNNSSWQKIADLSAIVSKIINN